MGNTEVQVRLPKAYLPKAPLADCQNCPLQNRPPVMGAGPPPGEAKYVVVGEAPGFNEVREHVPFVGDSGKLIRGVMRHVGIDPDTVYFTNAALCNPVGNKIPPEAGVCCEARLQSELAPYRAVHTPIAAVGAVAGVHVTGYKGAGSLRGRWMQNGTVVCTWHPAYILRMSTDQKLLSEFIMDMRKLQRGRPQNVPKIAYEILQTPADLSNWVTEVKETHANRTICFDLETDQMVWWEHDILCMAFAVEEDFAYVIPRELIHLETTREDLMRLFDSKVKFVGHNVKFDMRFLYHQLHVTNVRAEYDTLVEHYTYDEALSHGLKPLLHDFFDIPDYEQEMVKRHLRTKGDYYSKVPPDDLMRYNAHDVCYCLRFHNFMERQLRQEGLWDSPYVFPMMESHQVLFEMEVEGIPVDRDALDKLSIEIERGIEVLQSGLEEMAGREFNSNSWIQVRDIMYKHYKMPHVTGRKFKSDSTCAEARLLIMQRLNRESPAYKWLDGFGQLKSLVKLKSSYVDNMYDLISPYNKVHPDFLLYGTVTGRLSARDPAIQTIPRPGTGSAMGDVWGKRIKSLFVANGTGDAEEMVILSADYSQAEMRVAAALSKEPFLCNLYAEGRDLHSEVATVMYGPNFSKDERNRCKKFNFAYLYGGTEHSFAIEEGMDIEVARGFVRRYQEVMPVLTEWRKTSLEELKSMGYVSTMTGRRRRFPLITADNQEDARKAAINHPVQGMASDLTLIALMRISKEFKAKNAEYKGPPRFNLIITVHDSIVARVAKSCVVEAASIMRREMVQAGAQWFPEMPWKVDVDCGSDWGDMHELELT